MAWKESAIIFLLSGLCVIIVRGAQFCKLRCDRITKQKELNNVFDPVGKPIYLDKGLCVSNYTIEDNCELPTPDGCSRVCQPRAIERVRVHGRHGPIVEDVIRSCYAPQHSCLSGCVWKPNYIFMFSGSKYQRRIDVGKCVGPCGGTNKCLATKSHSEAVQGPNGATVLNVIDACSCVDSKCYRVDYFESFTESVKVANKNETKEVEKLINVGRCVGTCPGIIIHERCYPSPENCLLPFGSKQAECVPILGEEHTFTDANNKERTVPAVVTCGCGTG